MNEEIPLDVNRITPTHDEPVLYITAKDRALLLKNPSGAAKTAVFNMVCSVLARGILVLPWAFEKSGIILGGIMLGVVGFFTYMATTLLIAAMQALLDQRWAHTRSMFAVSFKLWGRPGAMLVRFSMLNFLIGTMAGFIVMIADIIKPLLIEAGVDFPVEVLQLFAVVFFIFPLCLLKTFRSLRFTSALGLLVYLYFIIIVLVRGVQDIMERAVDNEKLHIIEPTNEFFTEFPVMTMAFCIQLEIMPTWQELSNPTAQRITRVTQVSVLFIWVLLFFVAAFGYLAFLEAGVLSSSMSSSAELDPLLYVGKFGLLGVILVTIPLLVYPIRAELDLAFFKNKQPTPLWRRGIWAGIVLLVSYIIAVALGDTSVVFAVTSALAGSLLIYIFPPLFFLKADAMLQFENWRTRRPFFWIFKGNWKDLRRLMALTLILIGLFFMTVSVWAAIYG
ncbi:sodium-coupled neutral amino acid transporter 3 [Pelomyxa schiedti]|nr:sodium-coupled neutral amino acid transporter 3 [Pelomyxa schiedti]